VRGAGGCLTTKKGAWCGAVLARCGAFFVDLFHFLLLFVTFFTARKFYKLLFTAETGVKFVTFCYFFLLFVTFLNYFLLLRRARVYIVFIVRGGKGCTLIFYLFIYFSIEGEGGGG
jgi:hypothetical protein